MTKTNTYLNLIGCLILSLFFASFSNINAQTIGFFRIEEANDIVSPENQDRYFTQGLKFELATKKMDGFLNKILVGKLLPHLIGDSMNTNVHSISFTQNFFTPADKTADTVLVNDRPFAGTMFLTFRNYATAPTLNQRLISEFSIGILGPYAFGKQMQNGVHTLFKNQNADTNILGWNYQLNNDIYLNYKLHYERKLFYSKNLEANSVYQFNIGTIYNDFGIGGRVRIGFFKSYFDPHLGLLNRKNKNVSFRSFMKNIQVFGFYNPVVKLVLYNSLLQGGVINNQIGTIEHRLNEKDVTRLVVDGSYGLTMIAGRFALTLTEYFRSQEFKFGYNHRYGTIMLTYSW